MYLYIFGYLFSLVIHSHVLVINHYCILQNAWIIDNNYYLELCKLYNSQIYLLNNVIIKPTVLLTLIIFFLLGSFTGVAHHFDALFWHPHASSQHYVTVLPIRAIQFLMRCWEQRSVQRRARSRNLCRCRIPSARQ